MYNIGMTKQATSVQHKLNVLKSIRQYKRIHPKATLEDVCKMHRIHKRTYHAWCQQEVNNTLEPKSRRPHRFGNKIDKNIEKMIVDIWEMDISRTAHEIYECVISDGIKISYNTVRKIITKKVQDEINS